MRAVGIRELKNRLSDYLRLVRSGEVILVTDRGQVIAEIQRPGSGAAGRVSNPAIAELAARGLLAHAGVNDPSAYRPLPRIVPDGTAQKLLDDDRGER